VKKQLLIIFFAIFVLGAYFYQKKFSVITLIEVPKLLVSMRAKEFCSCHLLIENTKDYCLKRIKKDYPLGEYTLETSRVTFSILGISATAELQNKRLGCRLL
jgi:hypothetical protein